MEPPRRRRHVRYNYYEVQADEAARAQEVGIEVVARDRGSKKYELRPDELRILEDACRVTERVAELDLAGLLSATESNGAEPASAGRLV